MKIARPQMTSRCSGRSVEMVNREPDMNTRRDFLKGAGATTGIVFCSCGLRDAAWAQQGGGGQRLPVMVNGKRVKTIDVHAHCRFRKAVALMGDEAGRVLSQTRGAQEQFIVIEERLKTQGLRGAAIGGSVLGEDFSEAKFHPVWAKAEELGAVLFIHPQSTPDLARRFKGNGWLANTIGNPLDTTIALQHLIFEGTLDRFPGLKII